MKKLTAVVLTLCFFITLFGCGSSSKAYSKAKAMMAEGDYISAETAFKTLGTYKDAAELAKECRYSIALALKEGGEYAEAADDMLSLGDYKDAAAQAQECRYLDAAALMAQNRLEEAEAVFAGLTGYKDAAEKSAECANEQKYQQACALLNAAKNGSELEPLRTAAGLFRELTDYKDSNSLLKESCYLTAERLAGQESLTCEGCLEAAALYAEAADYAGDAADKTHGMYRRYLWMYVRENGTEEADSEGNIVRKLLLSDLNTTSASDIVTEERLTVCARENPSLTLTRELLYESGGVSYTETLCLDFSYADPTTVSVNASSYTDLGIYASYIMESYRGSAECAALKTRANIAPIGYVQQARQVSGKNTQTYDYTEQISIEKVLNSVPEFFRVFNAHFATLSPALSMEAMGFGIIDADPVSQDYPSAGNAAAELTSDLYIPTAEESFAAEQSVLVISPSGAPVYKGPSNTYAMADTLAFGTELEAGALSDGWLYVRYNKREYGWVDMSTLFGKWMFDTGINPALEGITPAKKYSSSPTVISTTDKANARSAPDTKADMLGSYITGTQGVHIGTTDMWYLMNFDGTYGWVHKNNFR